MQGVDKNSLSEADICAKLITPPVIGTGWTEALIRREVYLTDGRIIVRGNVASRAALTECRDMFRATAAE